jgi:hypothetical protein
MSRAGAKRRVHLLFDREKECPPLCEALIDLNPIARRDQGAHAEPDQRDDAKLLGDKITGEATGVPTITTYMSLPSMRSRRVAKRARLDQIAAGSRVAEPIHDVKAGHSWRSA